jgi:hypothetical protein
MKLVPENKNEVHYQNTNNLNINKRANVCVQIFSKCVCFIFATIHASLTSMFEYCKSTNLQLQS